MEIRLPLRAGTAPCGSGGRRSLQRQIDPRGFNMPERSIKIGLVGAGMFGGDVHLRAFADLQRSGLAPYLGRLGLDEFSRPLADVSFELVAVATRTEASAKRAADEYRQRIGADVRRYH